MAPFVNNQELQRVMGFLVSLQGSLTPGRPSYTTRTMSRRVEPSVRRRWYKNWKLQPEGERSQEEGKESELGTGDVVVMELGGVGGIVLGSWVDCLPCLLLQLLPATVSPRGFKRSTRPSIGFKHSTNIYIAGAEIYGGRHRMAAISRLYPALVTKETLLSPSELELFRNLSSQLAALDFIACAAADAFAMTDLGSQFSSLVQGYHMYYGGGEGPSHNKTKHAPASEHTCEERHNRVEGI